MWPDFKAAHSRADEFKVANAGMLGDCVLQRAGGAPCPRAPGRARALKERGNSVKRRKKKRWNVNGEKERE